MANLLQEYGRARRGGGTAERQTAFRRRNPIQPSYSQGRSSGQSFGSRFGTPQARNRWENIGNTTPQGNLNRIDYGRWYIDKYKITPSEAGMKRGPIIAPATGKLGLPEKQPAPNLLASIFEPFMRPGSANTAGRMAFFESERSDPRNRNVPNWVLGVSAVANMMPQTRGFAVSSKESSQAQTQATAEVLLNIRKDRPIAVDHYIQMGAKRSLPLAVAGFADDMVTNPVNAISVGPSTAAKTLAAAGGRTGLETHTAVETAANFANAKRLSAIGSTSSKKAAQTVLREETRAAARQKLFNVSPAAQKAQRLKVDAAAGDRGGIGVGMPLSNTSHTLISGRALNAGITAVRHPIQSARTVRAYATGGKAAGQAASDATRVRFFRESGGDRGYFTGAIADTVKIGTAATIGSNISLGSNRLTDELSDPIAEMAPLRRVKHEVMNALRLTGERMSNRAKAYGFVNPEVRAVAGDAYVTSIRTQQREYADTNKFVNDLIYDLGKTRKKAKKIGGGEGQALFDAKNVEVRTKLAEADETLKQKDLIAGTLEITKRNYETHIAEVEKGHASQTAWIEAKANRSLGRTGFTGRQSNREHDFVTPASFKELMDPIRAHAQRRLASSQANADVTAATDIFRALDRNKQAIDFLPSGKVAQAERTAAIDAAYGLGSTLPRISPLQLSRAKDEAGRARPGESGVSREFGTHIPGPDTYSVPINGFPERQAEGLGTDVTGLDTTREDILGNFRELYGSRALSDPANKGPEWVEDMAQKATGKVPVVSTGGAPAQDVSGKGAFPLFVRKAVKAHDTRLGKVVDPDTGLTVGGAVARVREIDTALGAMTGQATHRAGSVRVRLRSRGNTAAVPTVAAVESARKAPKIKGFDWASHEDPLRTTPKGGLAADYRVAAAGSPEAEDQLALLDDWQKAFDNRSENMPQPKAPQGNFRGRKQNKIAIGPDDSGTTEARRKLMEGEDFIETKGGVIDARRGPAYSSIKPQTKHQSDEFLTRNFMEAIDTPGSAPTAAEIRELSKRGIIDRNTLMFTERGRAVAHGPAEPTDAIPSSLIPKAPRKVKEPARYGIHSLPARRRQQKRVDDSIKYQDDWFEREATARFSITKNTTIPKDQLRPGQYNKSGIDKIVDQSWLDQRLAIPTTIERNLSDQKERLRALLADELPQYKESPQALKNAIASGLYRQIDETTAELEKKRMHSGTARGQVNPFAGRVVRQLPGKRVKQKQQSRLTGETFYSPGKDARAEVRALENERKALIRQGGTAIEAQMASPLHKAAVVAATTRWWENQSANMGSITGFTGDQLASTIGLPRVRSGMVDVIRKDAEDYAKQFDAEGLSFGATGGIVERTNKGVDPNAPGLEFVSYQRPGEAGKNASTLVPSTVSRVMEQVAVSEADRTPGAAGRVFRSGSARWRGWATVWWPGYWSRNMQGDTVEQIMAGVNPARVRQTGAVLQDAGGARRKLIPQKGISRFQKETGYTPQFGYELAEKFGMVKTGQIAQLDMSAKLAQEEASGRRPSALKRGAEFVQDKLETYIEDRGKVGMFGELLMKGQHPESARRLTNKALFDYADTTEFENRLLKPFAGFYTWSRKNIPKQVERVIHHPGKINTHGQVFRSFESLSEPEEFNDELENDMDRRQQTLRTPWTIGQIPYVGAKVAAKDPEAAKRRLYLSSALPILDVAVAPDVTQLAKRPAGDVFKSLALVGLSEIGGLVLPPARAPIEALANTSVQFLAPIDYKVVDKWSTAPDSRVDVNPTAAGFYRAIPGSNVTRRPDGSGAIGRRTKHVIDNISPQVAFLGRALDDPTANPKSIANLGSTGIGLRLAGKDFEKRIDYETSRARREVDAKINYARRHTKRIPNAMRDDPYTIGAYWLENDPRMLPKHLRGELPEQEERLKTRYVPNIGGAGYGRPR